MILDTYTEALAYAKKQGKQIINLAEEAEDDDEKR